MKVDYPWVASLIHLLLPPSKSNSAAASYRGFIHNSTQPGCHYGLLEMYTCSRCFCGKAYSELVRTPLASQSSRIGAFDTHGPYISTHLAGEKKLSKLATPDVWKAGSMNKTAKGEGQRVIGENKLLSSKKKYVLKGWRPQAAVAHGTIQHPAIARRHTGSAQSAKYASLPYTNKVLFIAKIAPSKKVCTSSFWPRHRATHHQAHPNLGS